MIPLRDANPTRRAPVVTWGWIALAIAIFVYEWWLPSRDAAALIERFGVVPSVLSRAGALVPRSEGGALGAWITPWTSTLLHADVAHLVGNLWFLHIFGDNVEDTLGRARYVGFVLFATAIAACAQVLIEPASGVPIVGASGAISGVLAAYVVFFPRARVLTLTPIPFAFFVEVPAVFFIFAWLGFQVFRALGWLGVFGIGLRGADVAWWAHLGGFAAGLFWVGLARLRSRDETLVDRGDITQDGAELPPG